MTLSFEWRKLQLAGASFSSLWFLSILSLATAAHAGSAYYVDCAAGDDTADGLSPATAWRSVHAASAHEFHPADSILFRRGTECPGMLAPQGSGTSGAPIVLDAWGEGPLPKIQAPPDSEAALRLFNQEYWTIQHLEFIGGNPHGVYISGTKGVLHGIHIRGVIVHGVTGQPKNKDSGLVVVAPGSAEQRFDDVLVDGVTAYGTSQWSGILVGGTSFGFRTEQNRSTNVVIRNSIVHDVAGDGIVLFQVNNGVIEDSVAWYTGMQQTQTIGTPDGIWTWTCRHCAVRRSEAFLTDSPGVDGGAFDIDYGNDDNVVEDSYGHDTQGYCFSVFGAGGGVTTNSIARRNVCVDNGRSPRLAATQGAVFLSTWDGGRLKGVRISDNRIYWNPPIAAAALVNIADFEGTGTFENNLIESPVPQAIRGNPSLLLAHNDIRKNPAPAVGAPREEMPALPLHDAQGLPITLDARAKTWRLYGFVESSGNGVAILASAYRQFHHAGLEAGIITPSVDAQHARNLRWDWNLGDITLLFDDGSARRTLRVSDTPAVMLVNPAGQIVWRHDGPLPPGDLGLALRTNIGNPDYTQLISEP